MAKKEIAAAPNTKNLCNTYILIFLFSFLLYANTLKHAFALDDVAVIEDNRFVKDGFKGIPDILTTFYWEGYWNSNAGLYRPLSLVTFAIEYQLSPNNPMIHHLINVLLYAITCCLLFEVLCSMFKKIDSRFFLFTVLLFIVHPIHTEVVANIKSRDEILSLLFFLLCCRQLYGDSTDTKKKVLLSSLFFFLALLSKEGAIAFLPIIFLLDLRDEKNILNLIRKRATLLITSAVWFVLHQYVIRTSASPRITYTYNDNSLFASSSILEQKATAFGMFARYIIKSFFPYELSYDYSFNQIPIVGFTSIAALSGIIIFAALIFLAYKKFKTDPIITFSLAMILLPLSLTGNIFFNIGATMADRFLFIPTIGSCILICWILYKLFKAEISLPTVSSTIQISLAVILLVFSIRTFSRNKDWKDNTTLFQKDVNTVPNSARAHYNNALTLQNLNDLNTSRKEYELCLKIDPDYQDALINLGALYNKQKEFGLSINLYRKALAKDPNSALILGNIGDTYYRSGETDSAIVYLQKAHVNGNINSESFNILGTIFFTRKEYPKACETFKKGVEHDTTNASLYLNYGNALAVSTKFQEAIDAFQHSYRLNDKNAQPLYFMAMCYNSLGDSTNSKKFYNEFQSKNH